MGNDINEGNEFPKSKKKRYLFVIILIIASFIGCYFVITGSLGSKDAQAGVNQGEVDRLKSEIDIITSKHNKIVEAYKKEILIHEERIQSLLQNKDVKPVIEQHIININRKVFPQLATIITDAIFEAETAYPNIPYSIILAVTELESTYKYTAISKKDCIGLMQINPKVWLDESNEFNLIKAGIVTKRDDLYDPTKNILAGTYILNHYFEQVESDDIKEKWEGALNKYFGDSSTDYFDKFQKYFGNFHLYASSKRKISPKKELN